uniref:Utp10/HEAT1 HEAT-repeats domain-containing protein n=1 Tax=Aegilops tauschii subsp. strangulata TaxID=200361 RepID=A0A453CQ91_AEGTS
MLAIKDHKYRKASSGSLFFFDVLCWLIHFPVNITIFNGLCIFMFLQIFIKSLTDVAEHRRVTLMMYLLRTLGENSLSTVIMYLLYTLIERGSHSLSKHKKSHCVLSLSAMSQEWEYGLAVNMTGQCSYKLWFPCLCKLLQEIKVHQKQVLLPMLHLALQFILLKLQDTE